jgi:hypothetical protein
MLKMFKNGPLRTKYIIGDNTELQDKVIKMLQVDFQTQWIGANQIRRDQLLYIYNIVKIIYDSPLRTILTSQSNDHLIKEVVPMYLAWHAIKNIFEIDREKERDRLKTIDKRVR